MSIKYNSLSMHLQNRLNESTQLDEGKIGDALKWGWNKLFGNSESKNNEENKGIFGILSTIGAALKGVSDAGDNKLLEKYKKIEQQKLIDEKDRLNKERQAEEDAEVSRIEAEYQHDKTQLDLATQRRVERYQATKRQLDDIIKREKDAQKNKTALLFTAEQNEAYINAIRNAGKEEDTGETNPFIEMKELASIILCDAEGNPRSLEDIQTIMSKPDEECSDEEKELRSQVKEYNDITSKYEGAALEAMDGDAYKDLVGKTLAEVRASKENKANLDKAKADKEEYDKAVAMRAKVLEHQQKLKDADVSSKESTLNDFTDSSKNPFYGGEDADGKVKPLGKEAFIAAVKSKATDVNRYTKEDGSFDIDTYKADMEKLGIPADIIDSFSDPENTMFKPDEDLISTALNGLSDETIEQAANTVAQTQSEELANKKAAVENAKVAKSDIEKARETDSDLDAAYKEWESLSDEQKARLDPESEAGKEYRKQIDDSLKSAQEAEKKSEENRRANKEFRERCKTARTERANNQMDSDLKDKVDDATKGIEGGEVRNEDGKIGFYNEENKFVEKPGPDASEETRKEYIAARDQHLALMDLEEIDVVYDDPIESVKKNDDGTYTITYNDKNKEPKTDASLDEATKAKANQISAAESKKSAIKRKQEILDKINTVFDSEGNLDAEKFDALTPEQKNTIKSIIKSGKQIHSFFKGMDLNGGSASAEEIAKKFGEKVNGELSDEEKKAHKEKIENAIDTIDTDEVDTDAEDYNADNWDDTENDGEDQDETEYEGDEDEDVEDTDRPKDADNNDLVKGDDGKWYKKKEDGSADIESGEQTNVSKKTVKKKLKNPAKEYKRRKNKHTGRITRSYYNSKGDSISRKEFKKRVENYQKAKKKHEQKQQAQQQSSNNTGFVQGENLIYTHLKNYLIEKLMNN